MLLYKSKKVLKKNLEQKFEQCNGATLFIGQINFGIFIVLRLKTVVVKCNVTGKRIPKRYWNEQTNADAKELSSQYKVSKKGWYIAFSLMAVGIIVLLSILYYVMETKKQYLESYMGKTEQQQREIRKKLNHRDLVMTLTGIVYKIELLNDTIMEVTKSNIPVPISDLNKPIDESVYLESSFDANTMIEINRGLFVKYGLINKNLNAEHGGAVIYQALNR